MGARAFLAYPPDPKTCRCGPLPHQLAFHRAQVHVRQCRWGIGGGKTTAGEVELVSQSFRHPGRHGLIVAPTHRMLRDNIIPKLETVWQTFQALNGWSPVSGYNKTDQTYTLFHGGEIRLRSSTNPDTIRGPEYAYIWLDEVAQALYQDELWEILLGRTRAYDDWRLWVTSTPRALDGGIMERIYRQVQAGNPDYWESVWDSAANAYNRQGFQDQMQASMSEDRFRREHKAEWVDTTGAVYGDLFNRREHVGDWSLQTAMRTEPGRYELYGVLDYGSVYNHYLGIARDRDGDRDIIFDEMVMDRMIRPEVIGRVVARIGAYPGPVNALFVDASSPEWISQLKQALRYQIPVRYTRIVDIGEGVELCKARLRTADGKPHLLITKRVAESKDNQVGGRGVVISIERYRHRPVTNQKWVREEFLDDSWHTHAVDAWRYYTVGLPRWLRARDRRVFR